MMLTLGVAAKPVLAQNGPDYQIAGTVTAAEGGGALADICVAAYDPATGEGGYASTTVDGSYGIAGLSGGDYEVDFADCSGAGYLSEWFEDSPDRVGAAPVPVTTGATTPNVDAALAVAAPGRIIGGVVDEDSGLPLEGICVTAYHSNLEVGGFASSAADGTYEIAGLPGGDFEVEFADCSGAGYLGEWFEDSPDRGGAASISVTAGGTTPNVDAELILGGRILGRVVDEDSGLPLESICVSAYETLTAVEAYGMTYADGTYEIDGLPAGDFEVEFADCSGAGYPTEWFEDSPDRGGAAPVSVTTGGTTPNVDAALLDPDLGRIAGIVTDGDSGLPLEDICISAVNVDTFAERSNRTGADGSYDLGLSAGNYRVRFADCVGGNYAAKYFDDSVAWSAATLVSVVDRVMISGIDAMLAPAGHIAGIVTDESTGLPVEYTCVYASDEDGFYSNTMTDYDGTYDVGGLPAGDYRVRFTDCAGSGYVAEYFDNTLQWSSAALVSVTAGAMTPDIDAALAVGAHITGSVTDESTGLPVDHICIEAFNPATGQQTYGYPGDDGRYDIGGLAAGSYRIHFQPCSGSPYLAEYFDDSPTVAGATSVVVSPGQTVSEIDAGLSRGGSITGTIVDDGTALPVAGICVFVYEPDTGAEGSGVTASNGFYEVHGLRTGDFRIRFRDCSGGGYIAEYFDDSSNFSAATLVPVVSGEISADIDAGLTLGGRITGTVTAVDTGLPIGDICVNVSDDNGFFAEAATSADGTYEVDAISTGQYQVSFADCSGIDYVTEYFDDTLHWSSARLVPVTAGVVTPDIDAALSVGAHITGSVSDESTGLPVDHICIEAYDSETGQQTYGYPGDDGRYDIGGLPAGIYQIYFQPCLGSRYLAEYFDDSPTRAHATSVVVSAGQTVSDIDAAVELGGSLQGTVTDEDTGLPLSYICVEAYDPESGREETAWTGADGTFVMPLPSAEYQVRFRDCSGVGYLTEWFDNSVTEVDATSVVVIAGQATINIDAALVADVDGDGVPDLVEGGAKNVGDGNNDGTPDAEQGNVASLPAAVSPGLYLTVSAPEGTQLTEVFGVDPASLPEPPPAALNFPRGLLSFTVDGVEEGATIDVEVIIEGGTDGATRYYKFHDDIWVDYSANAVFSGDMIILTLTDGGVGDDDGEANGQIVDPGGPTVSTGVGPPPPPPPPPGSVCGGRAVTIDFGQGQLPTPGPDVIRGTSGPDVINALGGDDVICGLGGNDTIHGGQGRDRMFAGTGNDVVRAGNGGGVVGGGEGDDTLTGGTGNDALRGRAGDDNLFGRAGDDAFHGGAGTDACDGGTGTDGAAACEILSLVP